MQGPAPATLTSAPLRHRLRVELHAPAIDVWQVVGTHERLPEYSTGIARVTVSDDRQTRTCHFRGQDGAPGIALRERIRWQQPGVGYSTSAEAPNDFGLRNDLSLVTVAEAPFGTLFTWEQYYDADDMPTARASFDEGLADIGNRLIGKFGGRIQERFVDNA